MYFTGLSKALYDASARKWKLSSCIICLSWIDPLIPAGPVLLPVPTFPCSRFCCPDGESTQRASVAAVANTGDDVSKLADVLPGRMMAKRRHRQETQETGGLSLSTFQGFSPLALHVLQMLLVQREIVQLVHKVVGSGKILSASHLLVQPLWEQLKGYKGRCFSPPPTHPTVPCPRNMAPRLVQWVLRCRDLTG